MDRSKEHCWGVWSGACWKDVPIPRLWSQQAQGGCRDLAPPWQGLACPDGSLVCAGHRRLPVSGHVYPTCLRCLGPAGSARGWGGLC